MSREIIQVEQRPPFAKAILLSVQHVFAMFGASVLVPILFNINPAVVLLMNGVGTLLFIIITKGKSPAYLGSSFAFLAPTFIILGSNGIANYPNALGGYIVVGITFMLVAGLFKIFGSKWISIVMPPAAMGAVIALIGLELAGTAASSAGVLGDNIDSRKMIVFIVTLGIAIFGSVMFKKIFAVIPILTAIVGGYTTALIIDAVWPLAEGMTRLIDLSAFSKIDSIGSVFILPTFTTPRFNLAAIAMILPASIVVIAEHIGHQLVTGKIINRDLIKNPGLHRSLFADGISTTLSGFVGSVPTTTYGENIGVMAVTRVYSVWVIAAAAILSILIAFIAPITILINSIPWSVIGGVSFLLYGMIASSGIRLLVDEQVDYSKSRNLILTSVTLIAGLSGVALTIGGYALKGMAFASIIAMALSLVIYVAEKLKWTNDADNEA